MAGVLMAAGYEESTNSDKRLSHWVEVRRMMVFLTQ
jgi:hypothetical protein